MRITKHLKLAIQNNAVIASGLPARIKKLQADTAALAEAIRIAHLGGAGEARQIEDLDSKLRAMNLEIPTGVRGSYYGINSRNYITIRYDAENTSDRFEIYLAGYPYEYATRASALDDSDPQRWLIKGTDHVERTAPRCGRFMAGKFSKTLCTKARTCQKAWQDIEVELMEIWNSVGAALDSVTTTKKLLEKWPEAEKLLPPEEQKMHLPAMPTQRLNTLLKL